MDNTQDTRKKFNNYLLNNEMSFKDHETLAHIHKVVYGGNDCKSNNNIFKWTMQSLNKNQRTISGNKLIGGKVSLPSNYFNPSSPFPSSQGSLSTVMSDVTPNTVRSGLNTTFKVGGKNVVSKNKFISMVKQNGGNMKLSPSNLNELYTNYNKNLNSFMSNVESFKTGGRPISKNTINRAFSSLKKN